MFQETWIAALRAYPRLKRADNLRAWLFRIAQNKSIDAHRARGRRAVPVAALPEPVSSPSRDEDPELWARVRGLPPKQHDHRRRRGDEGDEAALAAAARRRRSSPARASNVSTARRPCRPPRTTNVPTSRSCNRASVAAAPMSPSWVA